jgi:hypothetical protein
VPVKLQELASTLDSSKMNRNNPNNLACEASRQFRKNEKEYLKDKINELATNSKNKNIRYLYRVIIEFKSGYQPRSKGRTIMMICL